MTDNLTRYLKLERQMFEADNRCACAEAESLRDEMDRIWRLLSDHEHEQLNQRKFTRPPTRQNK